MILEFEEESEPKDTSFVAALHALKILSMKHDHASRSSWNIFMERKACIRFVAAIFPEDNSGF